MKRQKNIIDKIRVTFAGLMLLPASILFCQNNISYLAFSTGIGASSMGPAALNFTGTMIHKKNLTAQARIYHTRQFGNSYQGLLGPYFFNDRFSEISFLLGYRVRPVNWFTLGIAGGPSLYRFVDKSYPKELYSPGRLGKNPPEKYVKPGAGFIISFAPKFIFGNDFGMGIECSIDRNAEFTLYSALLTFDFYFEQLE